MTASPRRVTVLIDTLRAGGAERLAVDAACALDPERYASHFLVTRYSGPLEERLREAGIGVSVLDRKRGFHPRLFARAARVVAAGDLVHAHHLEGSMWGAALARAARRPLVAHEHTFDGRRTARRTYGYRYVVAPAASRIVCVSEHVAASLRLEGVPARLVQVVPNGVPVPALLPRDEARRELGLPPDVPVIGMVARLREEKRHDLALQALGVLRREGRPVTLCAIGDGPLAESLRRLSHELGVEADVVWAGERRDAARFLAAFDAALLCSTYEGMPLAALEALVAGVPLVATQVGTLPELLAEGGGRLVPVGDVRALADAISAQLEAEDGRAGGVPEATRRRYAIERMAADLQQVYDDVVASRGRSSSS